MMKDWKLLNDENDQDGDDKDRVPPTGPPPR